ncbi:MAG: type 1 glutamine amidotransferase [Saccharofermentanales bacterium]
MKNDGMNITICHLYPEHLNLYGDRGNILTLQKRCEWRGIGVKVDAAGIGGGFDANAYDIVFLGGGQDFEQGLIKDDLIGSKGRTIRAAVDAGVVFLCICGGYQMMGEYYIDQSGRKLECLNAIPVRTETGSARLIGNVVCESDELALLGRDPILVGFENHSGRTFLQEGARPLATVRKGFGNNGSDGTEGARYMNVYCTYMHGSFLPKNPDMADELIYRALYRKYGGTVQLDKLSDAFEINARRVAQTCK